MFFVVNNVPKGKKAGSLLNLIEGRMYALLKSLTTPTKPTELSLRRLWKVWGDIWHSNQYYQEEGQSIRELLAKLQKLAETCEFSGYWEEALRDRLVCTLKKAVDIAVGMELTDEEITHCRFLVISKCIKSSSRSVLDVVNKIITQTSVCISFLNAILARERDT